MLLTKEVEVRWNSTGRKHYEELGYNYVWRGKFIIPIEHLPDNSHVEVDVLCDYCLEKGIETHIPKRWQSYMRSKNKSLTQNDCCRKCWDKKLEDSMQNKYGVTNADYVPEFIGKIATKLRTPYKIIEERFISRGYKLLLTEEQYNNDLSIVSKTRIPFICPIHYNKKTLISTDDLIQNVECKYCALEKQSGENHHNWNGGISNLNQLLRSVIRDWKVISIKECNYKCVISGDVFNDIHHTYGFNKVVKQILEKTGLEIKKHINEYSLEEIDILKNKCIEIHTRIALGVCLRKDIHKLFHKLYGGKNNTIEQFEDFKQKCKNGLIKYK